MEPDREGVVNEGHTVPLDVPATPLTLQDSKKKRRFHPLGVAVVALFVFGCILSVLLGTAAARSMIGLFQGDREVMLC